MADPRPRPTVGGLRLPKKPLRRPTSSPPAPDPEPASTQSDSSFPQVIANNLPIRSGPVWTRDSGRSMKEYVNKKVCVLTTDGRTLIGTLLTADQVTNLVLSETKERIINQEGEGSSEVEHPGLYLLRGDNVLVIGELDEELDRSIDWANVHGAEIGGIKHT